MFLKEWESGREQKMILASEIVWHLAAYSRDLYKVLVAQVF